MAKVLSAKEVDADFLKRQNTLPWRKRGESLGTSDRMVDEWCPACVTAARYTAEQWADMRERFGRLVESGREHLRRCPEHPQNIARQQAKLQAQKDKE